jgi:transposase
MNSGLKTTLKQFAKRLIGCIDGIIAKAIYQINSSLLEGTSSKIKALKRMAYGFSANDYSFMEVKAAFHVKVR